MKAENEDLPLWRRLMGAFLFGSVGGFFCIPVAGLAVYGPPKNAGAWFTYVVTAFFVAMFGALEHMEGMRSVFVAYYPGALLGAFVVAIISTEQTPVYGNPMIMTLSFALVSFPLAKLLAIVLKRYTGSALKASCRLLQYLWLLRKPKLLAI